MSNPASIPLAAVLELVAMQLEVAMQNAASQAESLSGSVAEFVAAGSRLGARMRAGGDPALAAEAAALEAEAQRAMMAMQFHDQLAQRVKHVCDALGEVHDGLLAADVHDWTELLRKMRAHYSMEDERRLFDLVLGQLPGAGKHDPRDEALASSVELF